MPANRGASGKFTRFASPNPKCLLPLSAGDMELINARRNFSIQIRVPTARCFYTKKDSHGNLDRSVQPSRIQEPSVQRSGSGWARECLWCIKVWKDRDVLDTSEGSRARTSSRRSNRYRGSILEPIGKGTVAWSPDHH